MPTYTMPKDLEIYGDSADPTVEGDIKNVYGGTLTELEDCDVVTGWAAYGTLKFNSGGAHEVLVGDTLTGATSGKTCIVQYIVLTGGAWGDGDAAGYFYVKTISGAFTHGENLNEGANNNVCTHVSGPIYCNLDISSTVVKEGSGSIRVLARNWDYEAAGASAGDGYVLIEYTGGAFDLTGDDTIYGWVRTSDTSYTGQWRFCISESDFDDANVQLSGDLGDPASNTWEEYNWDISGIVTANKDVVVYVAARIASVIPSYSMVNPYSAFLYIDYFRSVQGDPNDVNAIKGVLAGEVVQIYPATSSWPRFSANKNSVDQAAVVADTETKVTFTTEDYDVGAAYDAANSKWIPGRIGGVHITSGLKWTTDNHEDGAVRLMIYKNGAEIRRAQIYTNASGDCLLIAADIICDAITDYFEIYCWHTSAAGNRKVEGSSVYTWFTGHFIT